MFHTCFRQFSTFKGENFSLLTWPSSNKLFSTENNLCIYTYVSSHLLPDSQTRNLKRWFEFIVKLLRIRHIILKLYKLLPSNVVFSLNVYYEILIPFSVWHTRDKHPINLEYVFHFPIKRKWIMQNVVSMDLS